jgi:hypothetical protein
MLVARSRRRTGKLTSDEWFEISIRETPNDNTGAKSVNSPDVQCRRGALARGADLMRRHDPPT